MSKAAARMVTPGNLEDDLERLGEVDWIVEAVVENLAIKRALYAKLDGVRKPGSVISSNTSTLPLARLTEGLPERFRRDFLITHFFNPPRYMRLVEIVVGPQTDPAVADRVSTFVDRMMGKRIVPAKDTPGFIANRIGTYWITVAINAAMDQGLTVEEADQIAGPPMGVPRTGVFGLVDLVGVDLMPLLAKSLTATLPAGDAYFDTVRPTPLIDRMIAGGFTGRKGKGGFYRLEKGADGRKEKQALDLASGEYRPQIKPAALPKAAEKDLAALAAVPGKTGAYAWTVLGRMLSYAASLAGEVANDIVAIDDAMKLGYNWKYGPFELIDRMGPDALADRLRAEGQAVPPILEMAGKRPFYRVEAGRRQYLTLAGDYADVVRPDGVLLLEDIKRGAEPLIMNGSAALWDVGDGLACLEFTGKMNAFDDQVIDLIEKAIPLVEAQFKALVIYNEGSNFSAGANLGLAMFAINIAAWGQIEMMVAGGQRAFKKLKYAPFPVVAAPAGMALGGGCEICLNADAIQAHAEAYIGLVETGVGLVPGWGGNGEMLDRIAKMPGMPKGPMPAVAKAFEMISTAQTSRSAAQAREMMVLRPSDGITMNRDRLLADAKARALALAEGYAAPEPPVFRLPGESGRVAIAGVVQEFRAKGVATPYDEVVASRLAYVLTGGDTDLVDTVSEDDLLRLEREAFMASVKDSRTQARIEHMLETGKPLRN
jgi:3-hydroxyacyl-CoA dehydrogenase